MIDRCHNTTGPLFTSSNIPEVAVSFQSLWKPFQTPGGMLFREKEHVIQTEDNELVCKVETLCLEVEENTVKLVKLQKYEKLLDDKDAILTDPFSGGVLVDISVSGHLIPPVRAISRKVMLYNYEQDCNLNTRTVISKGENAYNIQWIQWTLFKNSDAVPENIQNLLWRVFDLPPSPPENSRLGS